ncbi:MAG: malto-oligosyltrehalose trehalohydrolase [Gemmatales bacterium]|nr:malto-oligosyltrehalose trehalohydrolase [Gemmatales bacterium]MCS7159285.1 malto-oligosyltrehalose trehalohydrolase [Gemmatales bacterium]MDW8174485.1 malto-oligosyltrehalose trehalohydrolase [Gemmatales bacterium]MDW8221615.1 malto-oligosyltrehalose trehalohydrolase [Gemmatales bacterium]
MAKPIFLRSIGAYPLEDDTTCWRVWAPTAQQVDLVLYTSQANYEIIPMQAEDFGYYSVSRADVPEGQTYAYRLDGRAIYPDPASLWQPMGIHKPSAVVHTQRFAWTDQPWHGVALRDLVIYEVHCGTFTELGTLEAIISRLPALVDLGITAIELMPLAQFPGARNWGYDGVHLYAVHNTYGGPQALVQLVNACHAHGLAVILDVVYNHLGPEGNYLERFAPYFTDRYRTPWGPALNYDGPQSDGVRQFIGDNVRLWLEEYHVDGLRLDAVHAIYDMTAQHILADIRQAAEEAAARRGWPAVVIAESHANDPRLVRPAQFGGYGLDAVWNDDYHHALHAFYTGERQAYGVDFGRPEHIVKAWNKTFVLDGIYSRYRQRRHGAPPGEISGEHFVVYLQNHDLVANRAEPQRLIRQLPASAYRQAVCLVLAAPYIPLLFMGEEYGEDRPFCFFTSFEDRDLALRVWEGRKRELARLGWIAEVPDPQAEETFQACKLSWQWSQPQARSQLRRLYKDLLQARRSWPAWRDFSNREAQLAPAEQPVILQLWRGPRSKFQTRIVCNLTAQPQLCPAREGHEAVLLSSEWPRYGGARSDLEDYTTLLPWECVIFGPADWRLPEPRFTDQRPLER